MLSITLRQLEYAVAVARHGGVTAAAEALNVSQPALSVALGQIEGQIGQALFLRRPGGRVVPTSFGRGFLAEAERLIAALARLIEDPGAAGPEPVSLGCFEDLAPMILAPLLVVLAHSHPGIVVTPLVSTFEALASGLAQGRIDLAVTYDLGLAPGLRRHELARLAPHAVVARGHPLALRYRRRAIAPTLAELALEPIILADQGLSLGHMKALFGQQDLTPRIAYRAASLEMMRSLAANGLGVGLSYTRPRPEQSYDGRALICLPIADIAATEPVVLVQHAANPLSASAQTVAETLMALPKLFGAES